LLPWGRGQRPTTSRRLNEFTLFESIIMPKRFSIAVYPQDENRWKGCIILLYAAICSGVSQDTQGEAGCLVRAVRIAMVYTRKRRFRIDKVAPALRRSWIQSILRSTIVKLVIIFRLFLRRRWSGSHDVVLSIFPRRYWQKLLPSCEPGCEYVTGRIWQAQG
jgi:hypothetical protein